MLKFFITAMALLPVPLLASTSLTIFNQNTALVRDTLPLSLQAGVNELVHSPVMQGIDANSILLLPETPGAFGILEQGVETNALTRDLLLQRFEGKSLQFLVKEPEKPDRVLTATLVSANGGNSLVSVDGTLRFGLPGEPMFPPLPDGTRLQPAIVWTLSAEKALATQATLAYLASGLDWSADYTLVSHGDGSTIDLTAWVAITNASTRDFDNCAIKLMAGDVSFAEPKRPPRDNSRVMAMAAMSSDPEVRERSFGDLHLYTLPRPVSLPAGAMKQVEFANAKGVKSRRVYLYDPQADFLPRHFGGDSLQRLTNEEFGGQAGTRIDVFREIENTRANGLGIPLPAGTFRFYEADGSDLEFTGERGIGHTAAGETVRLATGSAFDLVGKRVRGNLAVDTANKTTTEEINITLRNRKDSAVTIQVVERLARGANWEILKSSMKFERLDSDRIQFDLPVPAGGEKSITYTVRYSW